MRNAPSSAAFVSSVFSAASCGIMGIFRSAAFASAAAIYSSSAMPSDFVIASVSPRLNSGCATALSL